METAAYNSASKKSIELYNDVLWMNGLGYVLLQIDLWRGAAG